MKNLKHLLQCIIAWVLLLAASQSHAQENLVQIKCFDPELKPLPNIEISINKTEYLKLNSKGEAFVSIAESDLPVRSIDIKPNHLEPASWNYSKGVLQLIVRKKTHHLYTFLIKEKNGQHVPTLSINFQGEKSYTGRTDVNGKVVLPMSLQEKVQSPNQFSVTGYKVLSLSRNNDFDFVLMIEAPVVQQEVRVAEAESEKPAHTPLPSDYFKNFDLSKLDSIQSLTVFYAVFKNYQMSSLSEKAKKQVDQKFYELVRQLEDSVRRNETLVTGRISDSSFVEDDIRNLLQQASDEQKILAEQRADFDEKIELINEKLAKGVHNLDADTRTKLLYDLSRLEELLSENENKFYKNLNDYRQIINSLKQKYFNFEELETKLSESEAQRIREQNEFRKKLLITVSISLVFAVLLTLLIYFSYRLRKQKSQLIKANSEIRHMNENLEHLISERTRDLEEAHRELDTFLYRASHDLRSPLCSIVGLCNLATHFSNDDVKDILDRAVATTVQMDRLLKKLTMISEINSPSDYGVLNAKKIIEDVSAKMISEYRSNVRVKVECPDELTFSSFPNILEGVLANLLENAIFYTSLKKANNAEVTLRAYQHSDKIIFSVQDNGIGIEEKMREKIFKMFYKGNINSKGNGLGLYIVQKSVQALKGNIVLESEHGEFSRFIVTLPLLVDASAKLKTVEREIFELV